MPAPAYAKTGRTVSAQCPASGHELDRNKVGPSNPQLIEGQLHQLAKRPARGPRLEEYRPVLHLPANPFDATVAINCIGRQHHRQRLVTADELATKSPRPRSGQQAVWLRPASPKGELLEAGWAIISPAGHSVSYPGWNLARARAEIILSYSFLYGCVIYRDFGSGFASKTRCR